MDEDWDLFAIVRSCQSATNSATTIEDPPASTLPIQEYTCSSLVNEDEFDAFFSFPNNMANEFQELDQLLLTPFNPTTTSTSNSAPSINPNSPDFSQLHHLPPTPIWPHFVPPSPNSSSLNKFHTQLVHNKQELQPSPHNNNNNNNNNNSPALVLPNPLPQTPRSRKRKSQQKKMVCHVTADNLSTDLWAWRKYGQKPIKGSPYPRNYYRCSSSKGCSARKQVERSNVETDMFIVTYTGDHTHPRPTHRNSLAGSTRSKSPVINPPPSPKPPSFQSNAVSSPPTSPHSPAASAEPPENDIADDNEFGDAGENGGPLGVSSQRTEPVII